MGRNRGKPEEAGSKSKKRETTGKKLQEKGRKKIYIYCWCLFFKNSDLTRKLDQLSSFTATFRVKYIQDEIGRRRKRKGYRQENWEETGRNGKEQ